MPYFEELDLTQLDEYYDVEIKLGSDEIKIDLNFEVEEIDPGSMDLVKRSIEDIESQDAKNRAHISSDFYSESAGTVKSFMKFHIDEIGSALSGIVDFDDTSKSFDQQLMEKLKLVRMGFYPQYSTGFIVFDYIVGREISDEIVVVNIDRQGELINIAWES
ncbi:DUF2004 domain-containing protein [Bradymonas sediminis]|uniref:DUF2004 domain-containing protein n=1 Tax=Bradymonas sediminis TaxID=1548548 RepID=UPI0013A6CE31|nr:DUF2004 domain-containing protein [Bradymonas sediminis]